ncbi:MAG TPA: hypothetical protein ENN68_05815 [Methanomicrobia archaeon]|nr:hypothetical protein [Methanomicrobia archaeon]
MSPHDYPEHHCRVIFAQDQGKEQFKDEFGTLVRGESVAEPMEKQLKADRKATCHELRTRHRL